MNNIFMVKATRKLQLAMACWGLCGVAMAQTDTPAPRTALRDSLGEAEVSAARRLPGVGGAVMVQRIDSASLRLRGITDTGDALRRLAGVNLRDYGGAGGLKTVSVRGLGASHTAVAYDGLCVSDAQQGQIDMQRFSLERVAALELQTLDAAQLLCPVRNLGAAVIYLQSIAPDTLRRGTHGVASLSCGSWGAWHPSLSLTQRIGKSTFFSAGGDYFRAENDYLFTVENGVASQRLKRTNSQMQSGTGEISFLHLFKKSQLEAKAYYYQNKRSLPGQVILYVNENDEHLDEANVFGQARWTARYGRWSVFAAGKWNWQKSLYDNYDRQYAGGALQQHYWQREGYATTGVSYEMANGWKMAYATDYAHASLNSNLASDNHVSRDLWLQSLSLQYVQGRWNITARGVAHLYWNNAQGGGSANDAQRLTPSLTASYIIRSAPLWLSVRAGWKESFRMPTFTESYFYHLGSTTLKPELARQLSAGLTLQAAPARWWPVVAVTADAYWNKVDDRIVSIPYNLFVWRTVNMGDVRTLGCDLTVESRWRPFKEQQIVMTANYSLVRSEDHTDPSSSSYGKQLAYTPQHSGSASLAWENKWLSAVAHVTFSSERWCSTGHVAGTRLEPWQEWGFALWHNFSLRKKVRIEVRADLLNAFDRQYEVIGRYPMPGRSWKAGVRVEY